MNRTGFNQNRQNLIRTNIQVETYKALTLLAPSDWRVLGLELLGCLKVVADEAEASGLSPAVGAELEDEDAVGVLHLVGLGEPHLQLCLHAQDPANPVRSHGGCSRRRAAPAAGLRSPSLRPAAATTSSVWGGGGALPPGRGRRAEWRSAATGSGSPRRGQERRRQGRVAARSGGGAAPRGSDGDPASALGRSN